MRSSSISIVIPTFNRHDPLRRALASAIGQAIPAGVAMDVVVVDNSADGNAAPVVRAFNAATIPIRYVSEPRPGVANARNAGVAAATGAWIAFLDDDEEAAPGWIAAHWRTIAATGADAVFGPVTAMSEAEAAPSGLEFMFARVIALPQGADVGAWSARLGTNNSVFSKTACLTDSMPFDPSLNGCGGEDSLLIKRLVIAGKRLHWSADAVVTEWVPPRRLNWDYITRRRFLSGQIRSFVLTMVKPPRWHELAFWMFIGAGQFTCYAALVMLYAVIDRAKMPKARASAASGLGKIFWMKAFRPGLYGKGLIS